MSSSITFKGKKVASIESLTCCLVLLLYFRPASYILGNFVYTVGNYVLLGSLFWFAFLAFVKIRAKTYKPSKTMLLLFALFFWVLVGSTVINNLLGNPVSYTEAAIFFGTAGGYLIFFDMQLQKNAKKFLSCYVLVGTIMCTINAFSLIIFYDKGGLSAASAKGTMYFLAQDNATYYWTWTVMVVDWIYYFVYKKDRKVFVCFSLYSILTIASYLRTWSVTPMIATIALAALILIYRRKTSRNKERKIRFKNKIGKFNLFWVGALLFNYLIAVKRLYENFEVILRVYLRRSLTLTGRSQIWQRSIEYIKESILIGYGQEARELTIAKIGINHTHNILLETMYRGGVVAAILFILVLLYLGKKSKRMKNTTYDFLMLAMFVFLCATVADFAFYRFAFLIIFLLLEYTEIFIKETSK